MVIGDPHICIQGGIKTVNKAISNQIPPTMLYYIVLGKQQHWSGRSPYTHPHLTLMAVSYYLLSRRIALHRNIPK